MISRTSPLWTYVGYVCIHFLEVRNLLTRHFTSSKSLDSPCRTFHFMATHSLRCSGTESVQSQSIAADGTVPKHFGAESRKNPRRMAACLFWCHGPSRFFVSLAKRCLYRKAMWFRGQSVPHVPGGGFKHLLFSPITCGNDLIWLTSN